MTSTQAPAAAEDTGRRASTSEALRSHVSARVERLQGALLDRHRPDHSAAVATLARLRRALADSPGDPDVWDVVFADAPEQLLGQGDEASRAERAMHAALVLYAVHAQSADGPRHVRGRRLGLAMGQLARRADQAHYAETAVAKRFRVAATATTRSQSLYHLRGLVTLLRREGIALDYGALAVDLWRNETPEGRRRTRLQWGRDFHRMRPDQPDAEQTSASASPAPEPPTPDSSRPDSTDSPTKES